MRCSICSLLCLLLTISSASAQQSDLGRDADGKMVAYRQPIPGTDVRIEMIPIPGGKLQLADDVTVQVPPFWIGKYEVTCAQYGEFMKLEDVFREFQNIPVPQYAATNLVDSVSAPSAVYDPRSRFEYSRRVDSPAVSMSQFAARQFTKWLSLLTATEYRLPRESEWKHACLAGALSKEPSVRHPTTNRKPDDDVILRVGTTPANAWGVHDLHGNVGEYVIEDALADVEQPLSKDYRSHRAYGGSFIDPPTACRCNSFVSVDRKWWDDDPDFPQSPTWLANTDIHFSVGFRIMRPSRPMSDAEKKIAWEADSERLAADVQARIRYGRGRRGKVDAGLPQAIRQNIAGRLRLLVPWEPR